MVISPEDRLISLKSNKFLVAQARETVDDLIGLEPRAVQQKEVPYRALNFTKRLAILMGI